MAAGVNLDEARARPWWLTWPCESLYCRIVEPWGLDRHGDSPQPQPRPKYRRLTARGGATLGVKAYVPERHRVHAWREQVTARVDRAVTLDRPGRPPWNPDWPLAMRLVFVMRTPLSQRRDDIDGWALVSKLPDGDNLEKPVFDALKNVLYRDDGQIASTEWIKARHVSGGVRPHLLLVAWQWEP